MSENTLLECLLDGTESTTLIVEMFAADEFEVDHQHVQGTLKGLPRRSLVYGFEAQHHQLANTTDTWWSLTPLGQHHFATRHPEAAEGDPLDGDHPPLQHALAYLLSIIDAEPAEAVIDRNGRLPPGGKFYDQLHEPSDWQRKLLAEHVTRALGRLSSIGLVAGTPIVGVIVRWRLTHRGIEALSSR